MYTDSIGQLRGTAGARQVGVRAETALAAITLSDPDPKMAGEQGLRSANQFVNGPSPERAATTRMLRFRPFDKP
jgi:ribosomal protein S11